MIKAYKINNRILTMPTLKVTDTTGDTVAIDAHNGLSLMEILRNSGYPIAGACNGSTACATCHVVIDDDWAAKLPSLSNDEEDRLDSVVNLQKNSRLGCQIEMTDTLPGMALTIPA